MKVLHVHNHMPAQPASGMAELAAAVASNTQALTLLAVAVDTLAGGYRPSTPLKDAVAAVKAAARRNDELLPDLPAGQVQRGSAELAKSTAFATEGKDMPPSQEEQQLIDDLNATKARQDKTAAEIAALKEGSAAQAQNIATLEATIAALEAAGTPISDELKAAVASVKGQAEANDALLDDITV